MTVRKEESSDGYNTKRKNRNVVTVVIVLLTTAVVTVIPRINPLGGLISTNISLIRISNIIIAIKQAKI